MNPTRRRGWLVLPAAVLVLGIAELLILLYRVSTGFGFAYNAEKLVLWGAALLIVAPLVPLADLVVTRVLDARAARTGAPASDAALSRTSIVWGAIFLIVGIVVIAVNIEPAILDLAKHLTDR